MDERGLVDIESCSGAPDRSGELDQECEQGERHGEPISEASGQSYVLESEEARLKWGQGQPYVSREVSFLLLAL